VTSTSNNNNNNNNNNNTVYNKRPPRVRVIDTPRRKATALSFMLYFPVISLLVGAPIPFPSLIDVSSQHVAFINFLSLLITLVGSIIGIGFYIERRNNLKFDAQNYKMDRIDRKIDEKSDWLYKEMREMEGRICNNINLKVSGVEKEAEYKLEKAKEIEDERFRRIDEKHREHERRLDTIDRDSYDYKDNRYKRELDR